jgi:hypothetical protein
MQRVGCDFVLETMGEEIISICEVDAITGVIDLHVEVDPVDLAAAKRSYLLHRGQEYEVISSPGQPLRVADPKSFTVGLRVGDQPLVIQNQHQWSVHMDSLARKPQHKPSM